MVLLKSEQAPDHREFTLFALREYEKVGRNVLNKGADVHDGESHAPDVESEGR